MLTSLFQVDKFGVLILRVLIDFLSAVKEIEDAKVEKTII